MSMRDDHVMNPHNQLDYYAGSHITLTLLAINDANVQELILTIGVPCSSCLHLVTMAASM